MTRTPTTTEDTATGTLQGPRRVTDAAFVVRNPQLTAAIPSLRTYAWATLLGQRGQRLNQLRVDALRPALDAQPRPTARHLRIVT